MTVARKGWAHSTRLRRHNCDPPAGLAKGSSSHMSDTSLVREDANYRDALRGKRKTFKKSTSPRENSPAGTTENSPGRKSWVRRRRERKVPWGRHKQPVVPRGLVLCHELYPGLTSWAIFCRPCGTALTLAHTALHVHCILNLSRTNPLLGMTDRLGIERFGMTNCWHEHLAIRPAKGW
jgi:hypothetical protein